MTIRHTLLALTAATLPLLGASAQEREAPPAACVSGHDMGVVAVPDGAMGTMDAAHADLMAGMDAMNMGMAQGMMAADIDVAFVCGMIAHHQGAIAMAEAVLAHGDDPWVRTLAEAVIAAQTQEIADMEGWLAGQPR